MAAAVGVLPTSVLATHHDLGLSFDSFPAKGVTTQGLDQVLDLGVRAPPDLRVLRFATVIGGR